MDNGKFATYSGPAPELKVKSPERKVAERQQLEAVAAKFGFSPNNPASGGFSDEDKELMKSLSDEGLKALYATRGVEFEETTETPTTFDGFSVADKDAVIAGISIPEMRAMAKKYGIKIPAKIKKADAIKEFLLDYDFGGDL